MEEEASARDVFILAGPRAALPARAAVYVRSTGHSTAPGIVLNRLNVGVSTMLNKD